MGSAFLSFAMANLKSLLCKWLMKHGYMEKIVSNFNLEHFAASLLEQNNQLIEQNNKLVEQNNRLIMVNNEQNAQLNELLIHLEADEHAPPIKSEYLD